MSLLDTASLIVTPNGYKEGKLYSVIPSDGSGDLSVTRATTATRVNSAGLVELVPYNLLQYSSSFSNAYWTKYQSSVTSGQSGYDGSTNAFLLTDTAANDVHILQPNFTTSGQNTISIYAKANSLNWVWLRGVQNSANVRAWFNLSTGTIGNVETNGTANIESVGNGWYRCSLTIANHQSGFEFYYGVANANNTTNYVGSGQSIFVQDAQLVEGSTAKDYQKTETRLNIPRLDYSNGTCPSILVEPQRTNSCLYSNIFTNGVWGVAGYGNAAVIVANDAIGPDGNMSASKATFTAAGTQGRLVQSIAVTSGAAYTASFYVKKGNKTTINFYSDAAVFGTFITFNFDTGTITNSNNVYGQSVENVGNGWYRISFLTYAPSSTAQFGFITFGGEDGYCYIWGAQLEAGSYATSYIPTTSASVTRNADVISKTGISSLIGQTEGTLFWDVQKQLGENDVRLNLSDGTTNNWIFVGVEFNNLPRIYCNVGGANQFSIYGAQVSNYFHKVAFAYKANDFVLYIDGVQVISHTSGSVPTCSRLDLGVPLPTAGAAATSQNKAVSLWKTRLTNTQLAQLTTI